MKHAERFFKEECTRCHSATITVRDFAKFYKDGRVVDAWRKWFECNVCHWSKLRPLTTEEIDALRPVEQPKWSPPMKISPEDARDPSMSEKERRDETPF